MTSQPSKTPETDAMVPVESQAFEEFVRHWCYWKDAYGDDFRRATKALIAHELRLRAAEGAAQATASLPSAAEQRAGPQRDELGWFPAEAEHGNPAPYIPSIAAHSVAPPAAGAEVASLLITLHSAAKGGVQLDRFQIATIASLLESLTAQVEALRQERQKDAFDLRRYESAICDLEQRASSLQADAEAMTKKQFQRIGTLQRPLRGTVGVVFNQDAEVIPLGLHETLDVYMKIDARAKEPKQ